MSRKQRDVNASRAKQRQQTTFVVGSRVYEKCLCSKRDSTLDAYPAICSSCGLRVDPKETR